MRVWNMSYYEWRLEIDEDDNYWLSEMDELRQDHPILWLVMVMGPITPKNIAVKLGWPMDAVIWELREYKAKGFVIDEENGREGLPMVWRIGDDVFGEIREWLREKTRLGGWSNPRPESRDENGGD
jgi:hypothetical protein